MPPAPPSRLLPEPLTPAQQRVVTAAHELFARHGVSGTSLQMIADTIGVTKAAVYHQFRTKDEIVLAATASEMLIVEEAVAAAEAEPDPERARDMLLAKVVETAVVRRRRATLLQSDPVIVRLLAEHEPFQELMQRVYRVLTGDDPEDSRVRAVMLTSALGSAVSHPLLVDLSDDLLRAHLLHFARGLVRVPAAPAL